MFTSAYAANLLHTVHIASHSILRMIASAEHDPPAGRIRMAILIVGLVVGILVAVIAYMLGASWWVVLMVGFLGDSIAVIAVVSWLSYRPERGSKRP